MHFQYDAYRLHVTVTVPDRDPWTGVKTLPCHSFIAGRKHLPLMGLDLML